MGRKTGARVAKITRVEVARAFGVHRNTVTAWLKAGKLKGLSLVDIMEFIKTRR